MNERKILRILFKKKSELAPNERFNAILRQLLSCCFDLLLPRTPRNFRPEIATFSVSSILEHNPGKIANLLLVNNFCPVVSYRRVQEESDELLHTVARYGPQSAARATGLISLPYKSLDTSS